MIIKPNHFNIDSSPNEISVSRRAKGGGLEEIEIDLARKRRKVEQEEAVNFDFYFTPGEVIDLTNL